MADANQNAAASGKKKQKMQKMALGEFLAADEFGGSWADDIPTAPVSSYNDYAGETTTNPLNYSSGRASGGYGAQRGAPRDEGRRPAGPSHPIPDRPPFTAFVGNLSFEATEGDLEAFFDGCAIRSIRLLRDHQGKPKGFGYVEFEARQDLEHALRASGTQYKGRSLRVDVAEQQQSRDTGRRGPGAGGFRGEDNMDWRSNRPERTQSPGRRMSPERRGFGGFVPPRREIPEFRERPKLNLIPRGQGAAPTSEDSEQPKASPTAPKANPFGAAKPVDTISREAEIEKRLEEERKKAEHYKEEAKKKQQEEEERKKKANPFGAAKPVDTLTKEHEIEAKLKQEREAEKQRREQEKQAKKAGAQPTSPAEEKPHSITTPSSPQRPPLPSPRSPSKPRANPFGAAKPVDTVSKEAEVERKLEEERKKLKELAEEKQKAEHDGEERGRSGTGVEDLEKKMDRMAINGTERDGRYHSRDRAPRDRSQRGGRDRSHDDGEHRDRQVRQGPPRDRDSSRGRRGGFGGRGGFRGEHREGGYQKGKQWSRPGPNNSHRDDRKVTDKSGFETVQTNRKTSMPNNAASDSEEEKKGVNLSNAFALLGDE